MSFLSSKWVKMYFGCDLRRSPQSTPMFVRTRCASHQLVFNLSFPSQGSEKPGTNQGTWWRSSSLTRPWSIRPSTTASTATASEAWTCPSEWPADLRAAFLPRPCRIRREFICLWNWRPPSCLCQVEQVPSVPDRGRLQGEPNALRPHGGSNRCHAGAV